MKQIWQKFWSIVWNVSEYTGIPLGRFAPWVFGQMLGIKGVKQ